MVKITGDVCMEEAMAYVEYIEKKYNRKLDKLNVKLDGEEHVKLNYTFAPVKFERIRRITGYLTGDTDSWGNAKQAELRDRVKHGMSDGIEELK